MIRTLARNWLLLLLCGALDAAISAIYLNMYLSSGTLSAQSWNSEVVLLGKLTLLAGVCTMAAGVWRSGAGKCWPLVVNGVSLAGFGLLQSFAGRFPISFLAFAMLIIVGAISAGILELTIARALRPADQWLLPAAALASIGFALVFLALGLRWIQIEPGSHMDLAWFAFYFGFVALCMLGLGLRLRRPNLPASVDLFVTS